jgi:hypothetical protein
MGDIVDWMFQSGQLDMPNPFDHDDLGDEPPYTKRYIKCRYCGSGAVSWGKLNGKWRLYSMGVLHRCSSMPTLKD